MSVERDLADVATPDEAVRRGEGGNKEWLETRNPERQLVRWSRSQCSGEWGGRVCGQVPSLEPELDSQLKGPPRALVQSM